MNKKVLCLGSAGFIVGNTLRKASYERKSEYSWASIDRASESKLGSLYINKNHNFYLSDTRDKHIIQRIFEHERPEYVIYGADDASADNQNIITSNIWGLQNIIDNCQNYGVKKFVYLSTNKVSSGASDVYGVSKLSAEMLIQNMSKQSDVKHSILRCSNNYGPRQPSNKVVSKTINSILKKKPIVISGDGMQTRDWICVFDTVQGILFALENCPGDETYDLSSGQEFSVLELVQKICNVMGQGHDLITFNNKIVKSYASDNTKLKELGWKPNFKLKEGLEMTVEWYKNNQWIFNDS